MKTKDEDNWKGSLLNHKKYQRAWKKTNESIARFGNVKKYVCLLFIFALMCSSVKYYIAFDKSRCRYITEAAIVWEAFILDNYTQFHLRNTQLYIKLFNL